MKLIIGSKALRLNLMYPNEKIIDTSGSMTELHSFNQRDVDLIMTRETFDDYVQRDRTIGWSQIGKNKYAGKVEHRFIPNYTALMLEVEVAENGNTAEQLLHLVSECSHLARYYKQQDALVANNDVLYALKMSHRYLRNSPHFKKTMDHIKGLRKVDASIPPELHAWFTAREAETYDYGHPVLNQSKTDFFDPNIGVKYIYDHDSIHEAVKVCERPAYQFFKDDQSEVYCSKELFFQQPKYIQCLSVLEESYVLAIERCLLHYNDVTAEDAFEMALQKVCTSISSGWWREFAWENYDNVKNLYNNNYYANFNKALNCGEIKEYKQPDVI